MLSTQCTAAEAQVTSRATHKTSSKPVVIDTYNQSVNGVDLVIKIQYTIYSFEKQGSGGEKYFSG